MCLKVIAHIREDTHMQDSLGIAEVKKQNGCCSLQTTHFPVTIIIDKYFDSSSV